MGIILFALGAVLFGAGGGGAAKLADIAAAGAPAGEIKTPADKPSFNSQRYNCSPDKIKVKGEGKRKKTLQLSSFTCEPADACIGRPVDIMLVLDRTGSMGERFEVGGRQKLDWAKDAAREFVKMSGIEGAPDSNVRIGVASFGDGKNSARVHGKLTGDFKDVSAAIASVGNPFGGTCIQCGLRRAHGEFAANPNGNPDVEKIIVLLTDGGGNGTWDTAAGSSPADYERGGKAAVEEAEKGKAEQGILYYVVGYGIANTSQNQGLDFNPAVMKAIASDPDSKYYRYSPDPGDWAEAFKDVFRDICLL